MATPFKRLVVLMMENRSFDHMLGFLKSRDYPINGLNGDETNPAADGGSPIRVSPNARNTNDLNPDPSHEFPDINWQLFSNANGNDTGQMKMQGFVHNYATVSRNAEHGAAVMRCFHEGSLPILSTLAKQFAVCDHWFSSLPGSTIPNRLFAHAAWSGDSLTQDAVLAPATAHTIFQDIDDPENLTATYRIYSSGSTILLANLYLMHHQNKFHDIDDFPQDCKDNVIPQYTFIEPVYDGVHANSQHPDFAVDRGEALIGQVYSAIRDSPLWEDTLLLIVYDEHGGLYDHVYPPVLRNDTGLPDLPQTKDFGFRFERLGVRVPAVFVSPWIEKGTIISNQFDHCSIVKTVRELFCLDKTPANWREKHAASFSGIANRTTMRDDKPPLPIVVTSDGSIPLLGRPSVLPAEDRGASVPLAAVIPTMAGFMESTRSPDIQAVIPPDVRKPTDLVVMMAKAMEHSLGLLGVKTSKTAHQIYSAQDADDYLKEAQSLVMRRGRSK